MMGRVLIILIINVLLLQCGINEVLALEHAQKEGMFSMDIPQGWHWFEYPGEVVITYPDEKTMAIDIQMLSHAPMLLSEIKKTLKLSNDKMLQGIYAHQGVLLDDKEIDLNGTYATRLDFKTSSSYPIKVTYITFFNKGRLITITYGSGDEMMHAVMDDAIATIKFK